MRKDRSRRKSDRADVGRPGGAGRISDTMVVAVSYKRDNCYESIKVSSNFNR